MSDPTRRHELRYWDGARWSEHVSDRGVMSIDPFDDPGWRPDPTKRHQLRYWDGARWSEHVSDDGAMSIDPITPQSSAPISARGADVAATGAAGSEPTPSWGPPIGSPAAVSASTRDDHVSAGAGHAAACGASTSLPSLPLRAAGTEPEVHRLDAIQYSSTFPRARDSFDLGGISLPFVIERDDIPEHVVDTATALLRECRIEPTVDRTTGATRVLLDSLRTVFAATFPGRAGAIDEWIAQNDPHWSSLRASFADVERGPDIVDFELLKIMTLLVSPASPLRSLV